MNALALLALSLAPGMAIIFFIYLKDKYEREPVLLLLISFIYGMLSTIITVLVSYPLAGFLLSENALDQFYNAFFKVAFIEELSKFVFVRFILFYNKNFNEPFDGIVYAVMVSMGFATLENIIYVFDGGFFTGILRIFSAVPAHATFAIFMGYFLGLAKFNQRNNFNLSFIALVVSTLFHGTYDYFLFISYVPGIWFGAVISLVLGYLLARKAIRLHQQASPFIFPEIKK